MIYITEYIKTLKGKNVTIIGIVFEGFIRDIDVMWIPVNMKNINDIIRRTNFTQKKLIDVINMNDIEIIVRRIIDL